MPETPKERRRRVLEQTAVLVRHIDVSIEKAHAKLKAECSSTKKDLLSRQISELEQFRYEWNVTPRGTWGKCYAQVLIGSDTWCT